MGIKFREKEVNVKDKLTMSESISYVDSVVNRIVNIEYGYEPCFEGLSNLISVILYYTDVEILQFEEVYENIKEYESLVSSILNSGSIDSNQYFYLQDIIAKKIEFKKQQILHQNNSVNKLIEDLLTSQIELVKLQKEATEETMKLNNSYSKEDTDKFAQVISDFNSNMNNPDFQKKFVELLQEQNKPKVVK